ncbi:hypothetical protein GBAR_LOCUS14915, partial [Geodia barretti]
MCNMYTSMHQEELVEVREVVEEQQGVLREREEERERLSLQVQAAVSGERDREDQRDRQHREDTASLAILQKQLSALTNEKEALESCLVMLQSSVSGCVQLASLVEQTLSPPSSTTTTSQLWHTPSAKVYVVYYYSYILTMLLYVCMYVCMCMLHNTFTNHLKPNFYAKKCNECVGVY